MPFGIHFVTCHGIRKDVDPLISRLPLNELRRHIVGRPCSVPGLPERWCIRDRQSEVDQLNVIVFGHHNITRTDVSMNPVVLVEVHQCFTNLDHVPDAVFPHAVGLQIHQQSKTTAFHVLHDNKHLVVRSMADFECLHDIRMPQRHSDVTFCRFVEPFEAFFKPQRLLFVQQLHRAVTS